jgi:hypothetical protein
MTTRPARPRAQAVPHAVVSMQCRLSAHQPPERRRVLSGDEKEREDEREGQKTERITVYCRDDMIVSAPTRESSNATHSDGDRPRVRAPCRNGSGWGFACEHSSPRTFRERAHEWHDSKS